MELNGIPLHPLVVHAAVVLTPMAALAAALLAVPRWRWLLRWPALLLAAGSLVAVQLAVMTGEELQSSRGLDLPLVRTHAEYARDLRLALLVLLVVVAVGFWALGHTTRLAGGRDREARVAALQVPLVVLLPVAAVAVLVLVVLTGDAGARAVWQQ